MWLRRVFQYAEPPNVTNLTAHGTSPKSASSNSVLSPYLHLDSSITIFSDVLRLAGKSLRWTTLGVAYNWDT
ncbi:hypothetical protein GCK32_021603, partial [Trichostrongylus colubriformis]